MHVRPAPLRVMACLALLATVQPASAQESKQAKPTPGDRMIAEYFRAETDRLAGQTLADVHTLEQWTARRGELRRQLFEMLGLDPLPERTPLEAAVTDKFEHDTFTVEMLHFQSRPGLYVTANLYLPKGASPDTPVPAVLYLCGHAVVKKGDVSFGNKAGYQHHAIWFARHGYACLVLDTLQLGEIPGLHHGTNREGMWWWLSRGYTPAGVEAWNCIRALDYLQTRREIDRERIGATGRSGGGAYSWWVAALDDRVKAAVPVAGVTDLHNHVVDGVVAGHCDCMYIHNTYQWDYATVAALVAPRPLLIANSDKDTIFPLDGVMRTYWKVRKIYDLYGAADKLGLQISEGPHKDTQELQVAAFRWMNRFVKRADEPIERAAVKLFEPEQLKVFEKLPDDSVNAKIQETFVPTAPAPEPPESYGQWTKQRDGWMAALKEQTFRAWPEDPGPLDVKEAFSAEHQGIVIRGYDFTSQPHVRLRLYVAQRAGLARPSAVSVHVLDAQGWDRFAAGARPAIESHLKEALKGVAGDPPAADAGAFEDIRRTLEANDWAIACVAPRGVGPTAFGGDERAKTHTRRRFMLLGQTWEGQQVLDVRRAVQAVRSLPGLTASGNGNGGSSADKPAAVWLRGDSPVTSGLALYAALFEPAVERLDLAHLPHSHQDPGAPSLLNVLRVLDVPQAVTLAGERATVRITGADPEAWHYVTQTAKRLGWPGERVQVTRTSP